MTKLLALAGSLFSQLANGIIVFTSPGDMRIKWDNLKQGFEHCLIQNNPPPNKRAIIISSPPVHVSLLLQHRASSRGLLPPSSKYITPTSTSVLTSLLSYLWPSFLSLIRTLVMALGPPRPSFHLKVLNLICQVPFTRQGNIVTGSGDSD